MFSKIAICGASLDVESRPPLLIVVVISWNFNCVGVSAAITNEVNPLTTKHIFTAHNPISFYRTKFTCLTYANASEDDEKKSEVERLETYKENIFDSVN